MKKITVLFILSIFFTLSAYAENVNPGDVLKQADNKIDTDLSVLTKKLKSVQNEYGPIVFKTGRAAVDVPKCEKTLKILAEIIKNSPGYIIQIDGHTDNAGKPAFNLSLSQRRSEAVMIVLIRNYKAPANRLKAKGFGDTQPIADNKTREGRAKNRRVDFTVTRL